MESGWFGAMRALRGAALFEALRAVPRTLAFVAPEERAREVSRLAKVSPLHALLAMLPDHPACATTFKAAYAQHPGYALTWASYAVCFPPWSVAPWVEVNRNVLRAALIAEPERVMSFCFQAPHAAEYAGNSIPLKQAFYRWLLHWLGEGQPVNSGVGAQSSRKCVGIFSENISDGHVLMRNCRPEIVSLRQAGYEVWLLQTGAQGRPVSGFDGRILLHWNGKSLRRGAGPALDAVFFVEPFGTVVDAVGAGMRWAPLQLATAVTPTRWGSPCLDFSIQGESARFSPEYPVIQVPGIGVASCWDNCPAEDSGEKRQGVVVASSPGKWSALFLQGLRKLAERGVELTFLPGDAAPEAVLRQVLGRALPAKAPWHLYVGLSRAAYLQKLRAGRVMIDATPYNGFSTVVDAAIVETPVLQPPGTAGTQALAQGLGRLLGHGTAIASLADVRADLNYAMDPVLPEQLNELQAPCWGYALKQA